MRHLCLALTGLMLLALAGCATANSNLSNANIDGLISRDGARSLGYSLDWHYHLDMPPYQGVRDVQLLGDLLVVIEAPSNTVWAVSARDGAYQWGQVVGDPMRPLYSSIRFGNNIFVNSGTHIFTLSANNEGNVTATHELEEPVDSGPVRYKDLAIFGAVSGRIFAHRLDVGRVSWEYQLTNQIQVTPLIIQNRVFAVDTSGVYVMMLADEGPTNEGVLYQNHTFGAVSARPTTDGEAIYLACEDRKLYKLDPVVNSADWEYAAAAPLTDSPMVVGDVVLQPIGDEGMIALNKANKQVLWELDYRAVPILERDGQLLLQTPNSLQLVDADDGTLIEEAPTQPLTKILQSPDDSLILVSPKGKMRRLNRLP